MRATSSFKLSKSSKRLMASTADPVKANHIKRMFIQAELSALVQPRMPRDRKTDKGAE